MQGLEVNGAVRTIYGSLGDKRLKVHRNLPHKICHNSGECKGKGRSAT